MINSAGVIEKLQQYTQLRKRLENKEFKDKYRRCRNALCLKCGKYKEFHLGACDGCIFKESDAE